MRRHSLAANMLEARPTIMTAVAAALEDDAQRISAAFNASAGVKTDDCRARRRDWRARQDRGERLSLGWTGYWTAARQVVREQGAGAVRRGRLRR